MNVRKYIGWARVMAALLCAALLAGCGGENGRAVPAAAVAEAPPPVLAEDFSPDAAPPENAAAPPSFRQEALRLSMRVPKTLNPLLNEDVTVDRVLKLVFEPLFILDEHQKPVPNLAEGLEMSEDGLSATIILRDDVIWSDGKALSAQDVIFSLETIRMAGDTSIYKQTVENMASFAATSDRAVIITFNDASGFTKYTLCFPVIPRHYYQGEVSPDSAVNMFPLGNGAYRAEAYTQAKSLELSANPLSFRETARIEKINVAITPDHETDLYAFNEGVIDAVNTNMTEWGRYKGTKDANIAEYANDTFDFIGFNFQRALWQDKRVRAAVAHAVDADGIVESIYLNHAVRAYTPISPASWVFEPAAQAYAFDLEKAAALLLEADATREQPFSILVNEENTERVKIAGILQENLSKIGLKCFVYKRPFEEYERMLLNREFDMAVCGLSMGAAPDISFAFRSGATPENGGRNVFSYADATLDALLNQAASTTTDIALTSYLSEVQKLFADELPCVSLAFRKSALLTQQAVKGDIKPTMGNSTANINEWFLSEPGTGESF